jgi:hypothetical protein
MTYNFELSITATVTGKVAEDIVRTVVEQQTGRKIQYIEARLSNGSFDGYIINFVPEKTSGKPKSTKPDFVEDNYHL